MNRFTSWLQSIRVRFILTIFLVGLAFLFEGYGNQFQALASEPLTPEATSYQVDRTDIVHGKNKVEDEGSKLVDNSQNKIKGIADNVREKLNLDEPLPASTKKFLNQVEDKVDDAVEPITGNQSSYK